MEEYITPMRVANSISQDISFDGDYIFVEGDKDLKLFKKFLCNQHSRMKITFGKKKMREIYDILTERDFHKMVGIRDADFIRLNNKFDEKYGQKIYLTDSHDSEGMIINSKAFNNFLLESSSEDNLESFIKKHGDIKNHIHNLCFPIACLRFANKKFDLGLAFKPVNPEGNKVKFKKFICEKTFKYLGHEKLINTLVEYSKNRGTIIADRVYIQEKLEEVIGENHSRFELSNGHDLAEVLFIICKKGLKSSNKMIQDASSIESMLRLVYSAEDFRNTNLYNSLNEWQKEHNKEVFL
ncbi:TPA: hypothetical protein ACX6QF_001477 [Photobacterium damselae]